jgi:hypothetical protein
LLVWAGPAQVMVRFLVGPSGTCAWEPGQGMWYLIVCRVARVWPDDRRNRNGSSMPWSQLFSQRPAATKLVNGKAVLVNGDFFLTRPPPELLGTLGWWAQPLAPPALQPAPLPLTFLGEPRPQTVGQPSGPLGWFHAQSHRGFMGSRGPGVSWKAGCLVWTPCLTEGLAGLDAWPDTRST